MAATGIAPREKRCKTCDVIKPIAEFYRAVVNRDGFENSCRSCKAIATSQRLAAHPEKKARRLELQRIRQRANPAKHAATAPLPRVRAVSRCEKEPAAMSILLLILLVLLLGFGGYGWHSGYATAPYGIVWIVLLVLLIVVLFGGPHYGWW